MTWIRVSTAAPWHLVREQRLLWGGPAARVACGRTLLYENRDEDPAMYDKCVRCLAIEERETEERERAREARQ